MAQPQFSIGIDLGTTNCALAFEGLGTTVAPREVFLVPQWETPTRFSEASTLPSFLYLLSGDEAGQISNQRTPRAEWVPGRIARTRAAESPGRVVHSAKSWLCHHGVDRTASFLPWRSDEIAVEKRISPIRASSLLLEYLRAAWDAKFAAQGLPFDDQEITITVPASFDAAAQKLTLDAAREAGFPEGVRLLEEPQAAFYWWLQEGIGEIHGSEALSATGSQHVLVIDIGGGTTDFTLFEIAPRSETPLSRIKRIAVSDHLLLGGDNIDLAIAHRIESRLPAHEPLSEVQWNFLVALCRDVKERCFSDSSVPVFTVSIPGRGSSLLGRTLSAQIDRAEIESIVLEGFFPQCNFDDQPARTQVGLREWALPYAVDSAVTRYLAEFLRSRPRVDAILFNGGSLSPEPLRRRLQKQIARWQRGAEPRILENLEPNLAVARGAAHFGRIVHRHSQRIEAGAARALYLEVHKGNSANETVNGPLLICILPGGAPAEEVFRVSQEGLELRVNRPVRFQPYYSTRRAGDQAGSVVPWNDRDFHRLPPLQTTARLTRPDREGDRLSVTLTARINELGLLHVACVSTNPKAQGTWPLEFDLRPHEPGGTKRLGREDAETIQIDPGVDPLRLDGAHNRITTLFSRPLDRRDKISAANLLKSLERILGKPKMDWNYHLIRSLWRSLHERFSSRQESVDHEETWLILAGYFLRPGFGAEGDEGRINDLWRIHTDGLKYPGKRNQLQLYILWRRVAGGLSSERQETILAPELSRLPLQANLPAEFVRLAGSLERISVTTKANLLEPFLLTARELALKRQHSAPYLVALGLLLNRSPLYAGPALVMPATHVERAYDALSDLDWTDPYLVEIHTLFLRAARLVNNPKIDLPKSLRDKIASHLQKAGLPPSKVARLRSFVPIVLADRANLFGESLPPGLVIG
ncbi:MAG TPA: Hsp70 family protein [Chthoniobacterales bacterium]|nr:Hsp70 family protein [Chthoniobacterales bacterium]